MKFFMRWKIERDTWMAVTMTDRPGCVRTMSAAARAASVALFLLSRFFWGGGGCFRWLGGRFAVGVWS